MIITKHYSDITRSYWDTYVEAVEAEQQWAVEILHDTNTHIAKDFLGENTLATQCNELSYEVYLFVPLTEDAVKAFLILADTQGDTIENSSEFKVRTPIMWDEDKSCWKLLPDLVKYAHRIYTELSDEMAKIENDINEKMGEG
jgi:hypothetical protein